MKTDHSSMAATACPVEEADTKLAEAVLKHAALLLANATSNNYVSVRLEVIKSFDRVEVEWGTYADGSCHYNRPTLAEAFNLQVKNSAPASKAERLKKEAADLLAKAAQLEAIAATPLPSDVAAEVMSEGRQLPGKSTNIHE